MYRLTAVVLSLLALSCSALKVPFAGRKVDARVTSPFVDFVGPNVDDAAESLRAEFEVLKTVPWDKVDIEVISTDVNLDFFYSYDRFYS